MRWYCAEAQIPSTEETGKDINSLPSLEPLQPGFPLDVHQPWIRHLLIDEAFQVRCHSGTVWVSVEGDPLDHVLVSGRSVWLRGPGLLIIEGLESSRISVQLMGSRESA